MNKNSKINEEFNDLYSKLEATLLDAQPNPYIALAVVESLKNDILIFLRGRTTEITPNAWYSD